MEQRTILCPVDFSPISLNAIAYAGRLAQVFEARLKLINVQLLFPEMVSGSGAGGTPAWAKKAKNKLEVICTETAGEFKIPCSSDIIITRDALQKAIAGAADGNSFIVMGTNGADDIYQYLFGTNTYSVIKKIKCPVLLVPESLPFEMPGKMVYAWDYKARNKYIYEKLRSLFGKTGAEIIFLHISKHDTEISKDVFRTAKEKALAGFPGDENNLKFDKIQSDDIADGICGYMDKVGAQMLAITYYHRDLISSIFHGFIAKKLTAASAYPILVLPG